jgi:hypothetical protein
MSGPTWGIKTPTHPISGKPQSRPTLRQIAVAGGWEYKTHYDGFDLTKDGRKIAIRTFMESDWPLGAIIFEAPDRGGMKIDIPDALRAIYGERCICDTQGRSGLETPRNSECPFEHEQQEWP